MSYAKKNSTRVIGSLLLLLSVVVIAIWQFYKYVTFSDSSGVLKVEGGSIHLMFAVIMSALACVIAFLVFSVFLSYDREDELHITFAPAPRHLKPEVDPN